MRGYARGGGIGTGYMGERDLSRYSDGGGIDTGYEGEAEEAAYRDGEDFPAERFADGGAVCPKCGHAFGGPIGNEGGPGQRVSVDGNTGGEEGPEKYASHGKADPHSPRESFGRALRKKFGHSGM